MKRLFFLFLIFPFILSAAEQQTTVVRVVDGDTVILQLGDEPERIRIVGIDTPEIVASNRPIECFGREASDYAKVLMQPGDPVVFQHENTRDKYNRALGYIRLSDETDFGETMISHGYAYAYRKFPHDRMRSYINAERAARVNKKGLWADDTCRDAPQSQETIEHVWRGYIEISLQWLRLLFNMF